MVTSSNMVAITGASGYIGRHLLAELTNSQNCRIRGLTRSQTKFLESKQFNPTVEIFEGDLRISNSLNGFLSPGCTVVHLAYLQKGGEQENLRATYTLLNECRRAQVKRLIHCSTAAVVGRVSSDMITEDTPCRPTSSYGITKLKIEKAILDAATGEFDVAILRPTAVFGAGGGSLNKLAGDLVARKTVRNYLKSCIFNKRQMNLVYVENVVAAVVHLIRYEGDLRGELFLISDDDDPMNNFADVEAFLMTRLGIGKYAFPVRDIPLSVLSLLLRILDRNDISAARIYDAQKIRDWGFVRPIDFVDGLRRYADWYRSTYQTT